MLYRFIYLLFVSFIISSCSSKPDIVIADFEGATYGAWMLEGNAFGKGPSRRNHLGQEPIGGYKGYGFVNSYNKEGGDARGILTSPKFKIERNYINFLIGGGNNKDTYIELVIDGKSMIKSSPVYDTNQLYPMSWNVEKYWGKDAQIRIVDYQRGVSGYILIDHIVQSNQPSTNILYNYSLSFDAEKKYLLIPIEEAAPEVKVSVSVEELGSLTTSYIRLSNTTIDYYIALDISLIKGKNIKLTFDKLNRDYVALKDIKQSDTYDYTYNEKFRPTYHFSSIYGWLGNPNGLFYNNGTYHLFYQHNSYGSMWGNLSWGHATSNDLITWQHHSTAIKPDSLGEIFSGTAVVDKANTANFGKDAVVAIYTSDGLSQTQSISYSVDSGYKFVKYQHNPVLTDPQYEDFRDPCVFWYAPSNKWIMALATNNKISFYDSPDLKNWIKKGEFEQDFNKTGVWEAPNIFPINYNGITKWVLLVSVNPGGPNIGSATQYFIGEFDGNTFIPDNSEYPLWLDYGRDNYAGSTWNNTEDDRHIFIGWMSNWDYANEVPSLNFRNALTIPRELSLNSNGDHLILKSYPVKEAEQLRENSFPYANILVQNQYLINKLMTDNDGAYELDFTIDTYNSQHFSFTLFNTMGESLVFSFDIEKGKLNVDRSQSGVVDFVENFGYNKIEAPLANHKSYKIKLLVDKASTELFVNNGEVVQTNTIFPSIPYNKLMFESDNQIRVKDLIVYKLKDINR